MASGSTEFINGYIKEAAEEMGLSLEQAKDIIKAVFYTKRELMRLVWMPEIHVDGWGTYLVHDSMFYNIIMGKIKRCKKGTASVEAAKNVVQKNWRRYKLKQQIKLYKQNEERVRGRKSTGILTRLHPDFADRLREAGHREAQLWEQFMEDYRNGKTK